MHIFYWSESKYFHYDMYFCCYIIATVTIAIIFTRFFLALKSQQMKLYFETA